MFYSLHQEGFIQEIDMAFETPENPATRFHGA